MCFNQLKKRVQVLSRLDVTININFHFILLGDPSPISNQMVTVKYPRLEEVYNALWLFTRQYIISEAYHLASLKKKFHMDNEKIHNRLGDKLT